MKNINKTTSYALLAAGYLAEHSQEGPVGASFISKEYNIPLLYLFKVLDRLIKANILCSKTGPGGGFSLARPAGEITILEIFEAVDGQMLYALELKKHTNEPFILKMEKVCRSATEKGWEIYGKATLSQMLS